MKISRHVAVAAVVFSSIGVGVSQNVLAHSGGTDANGCHAGSQPYHCHGYFDINANKFYRTSVEHFLEKDTMYLSGVAKVVAYPSCLKLNKRYFAGVAQSFNKTPFWMKTSSILYNANKKLDRDRNGIACGLLDVESAVSQTISCVPTTTTVGSTTTTTSVPIQTTTSTSTTSVYRPYQSTTTSVPAQADVPCGATAVINDYDGAWQIQVLSITPNAEKAVMAAHSSNERALPGQTYFMAKIKGTNLSTRSRYFDPLMSAESLSRNEFSISSNDCGPTPMMRNKVSPGRSGIGFVCWHIKKEDVAGLKMYRKEPGKEATRMSLDPSTSR